MQNDYRDISIPYIALSRTAAEAGQGRRTKSQRDIWTLWLHAMGKLSLPPCLPFAVVKRKAIWSGIAFLEGKLRNLQLDVNLWMPKFYNYLLQSSFVVVQQDREGPSEIVCIISWLYHLIKVWCQLINPVPSNRKHRISAFLLSKGLFTLITGLSWSHNQVWRPM